MTNLNYTYYEQFLIAYSLWNTAYMDVINDDYIHDEGLCKLLSLTREMKQANDKPISSSLLINTINNEWGKYNLTSFDIEKIYDIVRNINKMEEKERINELGTINDYLRLRDEQSLAIVQLERASIMLREGNYRDGIRLAKSLIVKEPAKLEHTLDLMQNAIYETNGFRSGIVRIDDKLGGFQRGNILSLAGDTGSMKTKVSLWIGVRILLENPEFTMCYFEKEMPVKDITRNLVSNILKVTCSDIIKANDDNKKIMHDNLIKAFSDNKLLTDVLSRIKFIPNTEFHNANDMIEIIEYYKPDIWVLDYLTMLGTGGRNDVVDYYMFIVDQMKKLKDCTVTNNNFAIILNQYKLNALSGKVSKIGEVSDIEYGSKVNQFASYIFLTFYPKLYYSNKYIEDHRRFYLVNKKDRHGELVDLSLIAYPEHSEFAESQQDYERNMKWLNETYKRSKNSKEKDM